MTTADGRARDAGQDELRETLYDLVVDHPMWIDCQGRALDCSPEREARIGDFLDTVYAIVAAHAEAEKRAAAAEALEGAAVDPKLPGVFPSTQEWLLDRAAVLRGTASREETGR